MPEQVTIFTSLRIEKNTKDRFDQVQRTESASRKADLNQNQTLRVLLDVWEQVEAGTLEVNPK